METINLQSILSADPYDSGIKEPLSIANMTTSEALEQIVKNATLSLFSDSYFLQVLFLSFEMPTLVLSYVKA
jgi:hypothetical protein